MKTYFQNFRRTRAMLPRLLSRLVELSVAEAMP
jgi:hypothetical protein